MRFLVSHAIDAQFSLFFFSSFHGSIAGKANLDKSDLEPALKALKDRLMTKNVVCPFTLCIFFLDSYVFHELSAIPYPMNSP